MIQQRVNAITRMATSEATDNKVLAIAIESNQRFIEYLDELQDNIKVDNSVTIKVNGVTIKFKSPEDMAKWITANQPKE